MLWPVWSGQCVIWLIGVGRKTLGLSARTTVPFGQLCLVENKEKEGRNTEEQKKQKQVKLERARGIPRKRKKKQVGREED